MQTAFIIEDLEKALAAEDKTLAIIELLTKYREELKKEEALLAPDYEWINGVPV